MSVARMFVRMVRHVKTLTGHMSASVRKVMKGGTANRTQSTACPTVCIHYFI